MDGSLCNIPLVPKIFISEKQEKQEKKDEQETLTLALPEATIPKGIVALVLSEQTIPKEIVTYWKNLTKF